MLLGEHEGWLEVVDIKTSSITSTNKFTEAGNIFDIIAIYDTNYLLCSTNGLWKTTKDQVIKLYF